jgi:chemotaxis protein methyltransferase CheR
MSYILDDQSFQTVRSLLGKHAGIELNASKRQMASNRLSRPMRSLGLTQLADYVELVEKDQDKLEDFVNAMTTNVTSFFREAHHFPILVEHLKKALGENAKGEARVWSAGCSSGQEPYSILIALAESYPDIVNRKQAIVLATDIDTQALKTAKEGIYPKAELARLCPILVTKYFELIDQERVQVKSELRRLVEYKPFNLAGRAISPPWRSLDAVFCRNVMIYFNATTQKSIAEYVARSLKPDGLFFTGHTEMLIHSEGIFQSRGRTVFSLRTKQ